MPWVLASLDTSRAENPAVTGFMSLSEFFLPVKDIFGLLGDTWWFWLPVVLFFIARETWLGYVNRDWLRRNASFVLLELRFPREVIKSPKAMEQVFANLHGLANSPGNLWEKYWDGEIPQNLSLEVISEGGVVRFFIRTWGKFQRVVEANFHAQYPDAEITTVLDYVDSAPKTLTGMYQEGCKVWGTELVLEKEDQYPIRTYVDFESQQEEQNLDPISALTELLARLKPGENLWLQILVRGVGSDWVKQGQEMVKKIKEKDKVVTTTTEGASFEHFTPKSPGEIELMKAIERGLTKPGFETLIRVFYFAKEEVYDTNIPWQGIINTFKQYKSEVMNSFRHNYTVWSVVHWSYPPYLFSEHRKESRRAALLAKYRERKMPQKSFFHSVAGKGFFLMGGSSVFILNTEELATVFHPPTIVAVTAPIMEKVESRRVGPSVGLDIFKEDEK